MIFFILFSKSNESMEEARVPKCSFLMATFPNLSNLEPNFVSLMSSYLMPSKSSACPASLIMLEMEASMHGPWGAISFRISSNIYALLLKVTYQDSTVFFPPPLTNWFLSKNLFDSPIIACSLGMTKSLTRRKSFHSSNVLNLSLRATYDWNVEIKEGRKFRPSWIMSWVQSLILCN